MPGCPIESLTVKQVEVLDMVLRHMSSKEIARVLGISHKSVDRRIDAARVKLGAATRQEAARIFGQHKYGESFPREALPLTPPEDADPVLAGALEDGSEPEAENAERQAPPPKGALWLDPAAISPAGRLRLIVVGSLAASMLLLSGIGIANGLQSFLTR